MGPNTPKRTNPNTNKPIVNTNSKVYKAGINVPPQHQANNRLVVGSSLNNSELSGDESKNSNKDPMKVGTSENTTADRYVENESICAIEDKQFNEHDFMDTEDYNNADDIKRRTDPLFDNYKRERENESMNYMIDNVYNINSIKRDDRSINDNSCDLYDVNINKIHNDLIAILLSSEPFSTTKEKVKLLLSSRRVEITDKKVSELLIYMTSTYGINRSQLFPLENFVIDKGYVKRQQCSTGVAIEWSYKGEERKTNDCNSILTNQNLDIDGHKLSQYNENQLFYNERQSKHNTNLQGMLSNDSKNQLSHINLNSADRDKTSFDFKLPIEWAYKEIVTALKDLKAALNWMDIYTSLDHPSLYFNNIDSFYLVIDSWTYINGNNTFPYHFFLNKIWINNKAQNDFLLYLIDSDPKRTYVYGNVWLTKIATSEDVKRGRSMDHDANEDNRVNNIDLSPKFLFEDTGGEYISYVNNRVILEEVKRMNFFKTHESTYNCIELFRCLLLQNHINHIERICFISPEWCLLGLSYIDIKSHVNIGEGLLNYYSELIQRLFYDVLRWSSNVFPVFHLLFSNDSIVTVDRMNDAVSRRTNQSFSNNTNILSKILDIILECKMLPLISDINTSPDFCYDIVMLASRRDHLNLKLWMKNIYKKKQDVFLRSFVKYLEKKFRNGQKESISIEYSGNRIYSQKELLSIKQRGNLLNADLKEDRYNINSSKNIFDQSNIQQQEKFESSNRKHGLLNEFNQREKLNEDNKTYNHNSYIGNRDSYGISNVENGKHIIKKYTNQEYGQNNVNQTFKNSYSNSTDNVNSKDNIKSINIDLNDERNVRDISKSDEYDNERYDLKNIIRDHNINNINDYTKTKSSSISKPGCKTFPNTHIFPLTIETILDITQILDSIQNTFSKETLLVYDNVKRYLPCEARVFCVTQPTVETHAIKFINGVGGGEIGVGDAIESIKRWINKDKNRNENAHIDSISMDIYSFSFNRPKYGTDSMHECIDNQNYIKENNSINKETFYEDKNKIEWETNYRYELALRVMSQITKNIIHYPKLVQKENMAVFIGKIISKEYISQFMTDQILKTLRMMIKNKRGVEFMFAMKVIETCYEYLERYKRNYINEIESFSGVGRAVSNHLYESIVPDASSGNECDVKDLVDELFYYKTDGNDIKFENLSISNSAQTDGLNRLQKNSDYQLDTSLNNNTYTNTKDFSFNRDCDETHNFSFNTKASVSRNLEHALNKNKEYFSNMDVDQLNINKMNRNNIPQIDSSAQQFSNHKNDILYAESLKLVEGIIDNLKYENLEKSVADLVAMNNFSIITKYFLEKKILAASNLHLKLIIQMGHKFVLYFTTKSFLLLENLLIYTVSTSLEYNLSCNLGVLLGKLTLGRNRIVTHDVFDINRFINGCVSKKRYGLAVNFTLNFLRQGKDGIVFRPNNVYLMKYLNMVRGVSEMCGRYKEQVEALFGEFGIEMAKFDKLKYMNERIENYLGKYVLKSLEKYTQGFFNNNTKIMTCDINGGYFQDEASILNHVVCIAIDFSVREISNAIVERTMEIAISSGLELYKPFLKNDNATGSRSSNVDQNFSNLYNLIQNLLRSLIHVSSYDPLKSSMTENITYFTKTAGLELDTGTVYQLAEDNASICVEIVERAGMTMIDENFEEIYNDFMLKTSNIHQNSDKKIISKQNMYKLDREGGDDRNKVSYNQKMYNLDRGGADNTNKISYSSGPNQNMSNSDRESAFNINKVSLNQNMYNLERGGADYTNKTSYNQNMYSLDRRSADNANKVSYNQNMYTLEKSEGDGTNKETTTMRKNVKLTNNYPGILKKESATCKNDDSKDILILSTIPTFSRLSLTPILVSEVTSTKNMLVQLSKKIPNKKLTVINHEWSILLQYIEKHHNNTISFNEKERYDSFPVRCSEDKVHIVLNEHSCGVNNLKHNKLVENDNTIRGGNSNSYHIRDDYLINDSNANDKRPNNTEEGNHYDRAIQTDNIQSPIDIFNGLMHRISQGDDVDSLCENLCQCIIGYILKHNKYREIMLYFLHRIFYMSFKTAKEVISWFIYGDDERKLNLDIVDGFVRYRLLNIPEYDQYLTRCIKKGYSNKDGNGKQFKFSLQVLTHLVLNDIKPCTPYDFIFTIEYLSKANEERHDDRIHEILSRISSMLMPVEYFYEIKGERIGSVDGVHLLEEKIISSPDFINSYLRTNNDYTNTKNIINPNSANKDSNNGKIFTSKEMALLCLGSIHISWDNYIRFHKIPSFYCFRNIFTLIDLIETNDEIDLCLKIFTFFYLEGIERRNYLFGKPYIFFLIEIIKKFTNNYNQFKNIKKYTTYDINSLIKPGNILLDTEKDFFNILFLLLKTLSPLKIPSFTTLLIEILNNIDVLKAANDQAFLIFRDLLLFMQKKERLIRPVYMIFTKLYFSNPRFLMKYSFYYSLLTQNKFTYLKNMLNSRKELNEQICLPLNFKTYRDTYLSMTNYLKGEVNERIVVKIAELEKNEKIWVVYTLIDCLTNQKDTDDDKLKQKNELCIMGNKTKQNDSSSSNLSRKHENNNLVNILINNSIKKENHMNTKIINIPVHSINQGEEMAIRVGKNALFILKSMIKKNIMVPEIKKIIRSRIITKYFVPQMIKDLGLEILNEDGIESY